MLSEMQAQAISGVLEVTAHAVWSHNFGAVERCCIDLSVCLSEFSSQGDSPSPVVCSPKWTQANNQPQLCTVQRIRGQCGR
jgi:hypothetical protein